MSCALQRACATAKTGNSSNGVPTYRTRSRQLFKIQKLGLELAAGTAGTVCGREKAVTCCMTGKRANYSSHLRKSNELCRSPARVVNARKQPHHCDQKVGHD